MQAWRTAQRAHAIANGVYVASPNRCGHEDEPGTNGIEFFGHSFVADPFGRVIAEAGTEPEVLVAECDPAVIESPKLCFSRSNGRRACKHAASRVYADSSASVPEPDEDSPAGLRDLAREFGVGHSSPRCIRASRFLPLLSCPCCANDGRTDGASGGGDAKSLHAERTRAKTVAATRGMMQRYGTRAWEYLTGLVPVEVLALCRATPPLTQPFCHN